jgi:REP element-mobilizing transposase RayT
MNRGNYREAIFSIEDSGQIFEETLFAACARFGWILHAYAILSNHFHIALETPEANLVHGMQWLASTFGNRFNRLVRQRGHVFQGRYKALLVEDAEYLLQLVNYIHLNPVRAGMVTLGALRSYALSSFPKFYQKKRPVCLSNSRWLPLAGNFPLTAAGMRRYHEYLGLISETAPQKQKALQMKLCRGWFVGTREGQKAVLADMAEGVFGLGVEQQLGRFGVEGGSVLLSQGLARLGKQPDDLMTTRKGCEWKVVLASWIKSQSGVSNQWLSEHLHMGSPSYVSRLICEEDKRPQGRRKYWRQLKSAKR